MKTESVLVVSSSSIKYGPGATREVGFDVKQLGARRVIVVTDQHLASSAPVQVVLDALRHEGLEAVLYDRVSIEPTDASFKDAIRFAAEGQFDGYVAVGGGSTIDTAKAANLYPTYPADLLAYVNPPIGQGRPVPGVLKPLIAIPTTAGTGSEATGTAIFDLQEMHVKTGIAHRALRPTLGIVDPDNTRTLPRMVAACTGFDVLCHAIESLTAIAYDRRPAPETPGLRPPYQGANPISDIWAARSLEMVAANLERAVADPSNDPARGQMILAATFAGIGFGNAGVHLPHAMSYPIAGMVREYIPEGYCTDHPIVPHGMAVVLTAPAVFRFTASADPARHLHAARLMGKDVSGAGAEDAGELLAVALIDLMRRTGMPNGLQAIGYTPADIPQMVTGALQQQRLTKLSPRPCSEVDLVKLFSGAMRYW
jgi:hydroxyacid-oxoacid transhydrogenase